MRYRKGFSPRFCLETNTFSHCVIGSQTVFLGALFPAVSETNGTSGAGSRSSGGLSKTEQVLRLAQSRGVLRARDLEERDLPSRYLSRLESRGKLKRVGRGLYRHPEAPVTEHHSLALVAARYPDATVCLLSALRFHELTTQMPRRVWVARSKGQWTPTASPAQLEVIHMSGESYTAGTETHEIEGIPVQIFEPAKTVVDCFKFRSKVGLDVAIEALRDYVRSGAGSMDSLYRYAEVCRVQTVMEPYIEATL
ncbi:type IV toxin-antitoxin system AbiEi family antitoxin domain-containing protein [Salinibacter ruber]|jgi:predicted transcriptional regulator of viral defense system|uniref:Transcriptional regulator of viral defense system n=1 Tax=Salinibacter ruber TaxID=146919 RepID=A0A9X2ZIP1_9BACT|nr:type IV toxin-antitoxin system AbiEi family antitoxin domain-containing protein [Salinibacter ruber]MCS3645446.1 putative transcriptional regulator of viral defense system [Salinibacter ruber]MCS3711244.1 putative transcriptional regulator of viral defense system [Salinibacter ruber]MCS3755031.1 putative transcriptional regulator of viral defense system [Salinibacter ruber]MCS4047649.1 putative transcriptional regulator of viral defense system [Salinibacter ruber]